MKSTESSPLSSVRIGNFQELLLGTHKRLSFHSQHEKKNRFSHFLAKTFGKRQTIQPGRARISAAPKPGGEGGPYRQRKSSGGSCGISNELINIRASQPSSAGKNVSNLPVDSSESLVSPSRQGFQRNRVPEISDWQRWSTEAKKFKEETGL